MRVNFIRMTINAAKHPGINSIANGLRMIIRLLEIYGPERESSVLIGKEATNQWIGNNGGLSKYQVQHCLDQLSQIIIEDQPLIKIEVKFVPGKGNQRFIDLFGLQKLDCDFTTFFNRYCNEAKTKAKKVEKDDSLVKSTLVKSTLVKSTLVKSALVKSTRPISMNNNPKGLLFRPNENLDDFQVVNKHKDDIEEAKPIEQPKPIIEASKSKVFGNKLFNSHQFKFDAFHIQEKLGGSWKHDPSKPKSMNSTNLIPFKVIKEANDSLEIEDSRFIELSMMIDDIHKLDTGSYFFEPNERALFYRVVRAMVFEHTKDFNHIWIDQDNLNRINWIGKRPADILFIDSNGFDDLSFIDGLSLPIIILKADKLDAI
jgi:hypothetical protein